MLQELTDPVIAVDLGGTNIRVATFLNGAMQARAQRPTPARDGPRAVAEAITATVQEVLAAGDTTPFATAPVGVAAPGPLNGRAGIVYSPPNLYGWRDVPLVALLQTRLARSIYLIKDTNAAALAEHHLGAGQGTHTMLYVTLSTGVGGGLILDGRLFEGPDGTAGEVGHVTVDQHGPRCNCGNIGCVEAVASGTAIARQAQELIAAGDLAPLEGSRVPTAAAVFAAAQRGDSAALALVERAGRALGLAFAGLLHLFNPEAIVIGGGMVQAGDVLLHPLGQTLDQYAMAVPRARVRLLTAALDVDVGLWGAGLYALEMALR
jgi:glucokinase